MCSSDLLLSKEPHRRPASEEIISVLERIASPQTLLVRKQPPSQEETGTTADPWKWARYATAALTASAVTGTLIAAAMWPTTKHPTTNVPEGWKVHRKLGASIAVPGSYQARDLYDHGGGVAFEAEKGQVHRELLLLRWDVLGGSPAKRADYWYRRFTENPKFTDRQITLTETTLNGRKSKVLNMTYRPEGGQLWRKKELYYNANGRLWKLIFDAAITNEQDTTGDDLFETAMRTLKTD